MTKIHRRLCLQEGYSAILRRCPFNSTIKTAISHYRSCQWPCSSDHTLPGGASPGAPGDLLFVIKLTIDMITNRAIITAPMITLLLLFFFRPPSFSWQFLYFFPLPQGHSSFLPTFSIFNIVSPSNLLILFSFFKFLFSK